MFFVFYWKQMLKIFVNYRKQFLMSCFNKSLQQGCSFERVLPRKEVICFKQSHCCFKKRNRLFKTSAPSIYKYNTLIKMDVNVQTNCFNFERHYGILQSKSPCILLNKSINFNKNGTESKIENPSQNFRETNLILSSPKTRKLKVTL